MQTTSAEHDADLRLQLWGVRGSTPTPVAKNLGYGGNTPCVACAVGTDHLLVFDAGSGIRELGLELMQRPALPKIHLFFTHFHWDHVQGLPFFTPLFQKDAQIVMHSAREPEELRAILSRQMAAPFFPVAFDELAANIEFRQIVNEPVAVGDVTVQGIRLHHPQWAQGYRIADARQSIVFATDHEHGEAEVDAGLRAAACGADVLLYDAQYTDAEYETRRGWGHSTWREAVRVARDAEVKKLVLFHHDPNHDDAVLDLIVAEAQAEFPETVGARERHCV